MISAIVEVKNRICLLFLILLSILIIIYYYYFSLLVLIIISNTLLSYEILNYFIFTNIAEFFFIYILLSFFVAKYILYFALIYHIICFLSSGLYRSEYVYLKFLFIICLFFTWISNKISYKILIPATTTFFFSFQNYATSQSMPFYFEAKIYDYLTFFFEIYFSCFYSFQLCTILFLLANYASKNLRFLKSVRRIFYLFFLTLSTIITPPDIFSQLFVFFSFLIIFEAFIFINIVVNTLKKFN